MQEQTNYYAVQHCLNFLILFYNIFFFCLSQSSVERGYNFLLRLFYNYSQLAIFSGVFFFYRTHKLGVLLKIVRV